MKRKLWIWMFGISLALLILLLLFTVGIWALGNATGAMAGAIMGSLDPENFGYHYLAFDTFLLNAVGSPIFYCFCVDLIVLLCSIVMLVLSKQRYNASPIA